MHHELVERKRWVSEKQYLRTLNFCMLLPGPEAQQVATYIGWRLHGTMGGIVDGSFFVIPSIFVLWLLSYLAVAHSDVPGITGLLYGIQPVVIAIVVEAVLRIAKRALNHYLLVGFSVAAFVALFFLSLPFPLVVLAAGLGGLLLSRAVPEAFQDGGHGSAQEEESPSSPSSCCRGSRFRSTSWSPPARSWDDMDAPVEAKIGLFIPIYHVPPEPSGLQREAL